MSPPSSSSGPPTATHSTTQSDRNITIVVLLDFIIAVHPALSVVFYLFIIIIIIILFYFFIYLLFFFCLLPIVSAMSKVEHYVLWCVGSSWAMRVNADKLIINCHHTALSEWHTGIKIILNKKNRTCARKMFNN